VCNFAEKLGEGYLPVVGGVIVVLSDFINYLTICAFNIITTVTLFTEND